MRNSPPPEFVPFGYIRGAGARRELRSDEKHLRSQIDGGNLA
ncbi:MAG TPA: hypothetical protein VFW94_02070 [Candidatus Acidoferrales bacterium]|nr:hypothetical protein [Candidatus Acidoferrales bacterium]